MAEIDDAEKLAALFVDYARLEAENRELREKQDESIFDLSRLQDINTALQQLLTAANARIDKLDRLNEALMRHRNYDPGAGNVLSGFLDERDMWKIKAEAAETQVRELSKPITAMEWNSLSAISTMPARFNQIIERRIAPPAPSSAPELEVKP